MLGGMIVARREGRKDGRDGPKWAFLEMPRTTGLLCHHGGMLSPLYKPHTGRGSLAQKWGLPMFK